MPCTTSASSTRCVGRSLGLIVVSSQHVVVVRLLSCCTNLLIQSGPVWCLWCTITAIAWASLLQVHLEAAATVGIIPHLVRIANEGLQAMMAAAQAAAAALAASGPGPSSGQQHNQPQVLPLSVGEAAEAAAASDEASLLDPLARCGGGEPVTCWACIWASRIRHVCCWASILVSQPAVQRHILLRTSLGMSLAVAACCMQTQAVSTLIAQRIACPISTGGCRWARLRGFVVTMLVNLVSCSSSTRAKLWAASGLDVFLHLLAEQVTRGKPASTLIDKELTVAYASYPLAQSCSIRMLPGVLPGMCTPRIAETHTTTLRPSSACPLLDTLNVSLPSLAPSLPPGKC
jgi:hypothetical protein